MKIFSGVIDINGTLFLMFSAFIITLLGYLIGRIRIKGISLGTAGVFLTALIYGALFPDFISSNIYQTTKGEKIDVSSTTLKLLENLGLIIFIASIGFISGPNFFRNIVKNVKSSLVLGLLINISAALACVLCYFIGRGAEKDKKEFGVLLVGLFSGAVTSTPSFSAAKATADPKYESAVTVGYGIAYLFGVFCPVLFVQLAPRVMCVDINVERELILGEETNTVIPADESKKENNENKNELKDCVAINAKEDSGAQNQDTIKIKDNDENKKLEQKEIIPILSTEERDLKENNELNEIKKNEDIKNELTIKNDEDKENKDKNDNKENNENRDCIISVRENNNKIRNIKEESESLFIIDRFGFCIFSLGSLVGIFVGAIKIPLSNKGLDGMTFSLTYTGGILFISLFLGHLGKVGRLSLKMEKKMMEMTKELGLFLFYVGVGIPGGGRFVNYFKTIYFVYGIIMTIFPCVFALIIGKYVLKIPLLKTLGSITGGITSTPSLVSLINMCQENKVIEFYATTYPVAIISVIFVSQILVLLLGK